MGHEGLQQLVLAVTESSDERLPGNARFACQAIIAQLHAVQTQITGLDKRVTLAHRANADSKRLEAIPGFGVILSTAVVATMTDPKAFRTGREFAAWIGLVRVVPKLLELAGPLVRRCTGFHANEARRQIGKKLKNL